MRIKTRAVILFSICTASFLFVLYKSSLRHSVKEEEIQKDIEIWTPAWPSRKSKIPCLTLLESLHPPYPVLLFDINFLQQLENDEVCLKKDFPPLFAHPSEHFMKDLNVPLFEDSSHSNFYKIIENRNERGIFKNQFYSKNNWTIPENVTVFEELWKRSKLLTCKDLWMFRNPLNSRHSWTDREALEAMDELVQHFLQYDMHIFMCSGTLLGWYRECGFIPHTHDVDFGLMQEEFLEEPFLEIVKNNTRFRPYIKYMEGNTTLEYTLYPSQSSNFPRMDVFLFFNTEQNSSTLSFGWGRKYRFTYPELYKPYCAVDFHGHLFWTTCSPEMAIKSDYGEKWYRDYHSSTYNYVYSTWNMQEEGDFNETEGLVYYEEFDTISDHSSISFAITTIITFLIQALL